VCRSVEVVGEDAEGVAEALLEQLVRELMVGDGAGQLSTCWAAPLVLRLTVLYGLTNVML
jgi:hypothetical protein